MLRSQNAEEVGWQAVDPPDTSLSYVYRYREPGGGSYAAIANARIAHGLFYRKENKELGGWLAGWLSLSKANDL